MLWAKLWLPKEAEAMDEAQRILSCSLRLLQMLYIKLGAREGSTN